MNTPEELIEDIRQGKMIILIDDEDRENEGDIVLAADFVDSEKINFMIAEARGLVCLSMTEQQISKLELPLMIGDSFNRSPNKTAFTVSIEAAQGISTGISPADRAHTIRVASRPEAQAQDLICPGHVFPIQAKKGGVLKRAGHTEGSVDLAQLAGLNPSAVICEIINPDGSMARVPHLLEFAKKWNLKIGTIESLITYRLKTEFFVQCLSKKKLITPWGTAQLSVYKDEFDGGEHLAFEFGEPSVAPLVRVHSQELFTDLFENSKIQNMMAQVSGEAYGVFVYISHPARFEESLSGVSGATNDRNFGIGAQILKLLNIKEMNLLTNSQHKRVGLGAYDLEIINTVPLVH